MKVIANTDKRHAPLAAADEQGNVIWQVEYKAWGRISPASLRAEQSNANQRKPTKGYSTLTCLFDQWQDEPLD